MGKSTGSWDNKTSRAVPSLTKAVSQKLNKNCKAEQRMVIRQLSRTLNMSMVTREIWGQAGKSGPWVSIRMSRVHDQAQIHQQCSLDEKPSTLLQTKRGQNLSSFKTLTSTSFPESDPRFHSCIKSKLALSTGSQNHGKEGWRKRFQTPLMNLTGVAAVGQYSCTNYAGLFDPMSQICFPDCGT